jgi:hypothetical protein
MHLYETDQDYRASVQLRSIPSRSWWGVNSLVIPAQGPDKFCGAETTLELCETQAVARLVTVLGR